MTSQFTPRDRLIAALAPTHIRPRDFVAMPEALRMEALRSAAVPPAACGRDVHAAPARGPYLVTNPIGMVPKGADDWEAQPVAFRGRSVLQRADVFDAMNAKAKARGGDLFTEGQMWVARRYRALVEGRTAGGVKCSSMGGNGGGGGGDGARDFMDHYIADGEALALLTQRIGVGAAMMVRRVRPSARGEDRAMLIRDRALVDMICLRDMTPSAVLKRHGWGNDGKHRKMIKMALVAVLDRMQGFPVASDAK
jgi:hypothetical protein